MRKANSVGLLLMAIAGGAGQRAQAQTPPTPAQWQQIDVAIGRTGAPQDGGVRRYSFPRSDMQVTADGVPVRAALALGSWAAFLPSTGGFLVMGDLVLSEGEVPGVMDALQRGGIGQTAIHHHILNESPRVLYMHIHAHGEGVALARSIRDAVSRTATPPPAPPSAVPLDLDTAAIRGALGHAGRANGGVYQVNVARKHAIHAHGVEIPASMGFSTVINFQPTDAGRTAITGDFVLTAGEVNPVIRALRQHGIAVTALHNHLLEEEPRLFFMHFWANDDALRLARGLRSALDLTPQ